MQPDRGVAQGRHGGSLTTPRVVAGARRAWQRPVAPAKRAVVVVGRLSSRHGADHRQVCRSGFPGGRCTRRCRLLPPVCVAWGLSAPNARPDLRPCRMSCRAPRRPNFAMRSFGMDVVGRETWRHV